MAGSAATWRSGRCRSAEQYIGLLPRLDYVLLTGQLPLTDELLRYSPSGDLFRLRHKTQASVRNPATLGSKEFLILSTHGGLRAEDGSPVCAWLSHRALGSRAAGQSRGRRVQAAGIHSLCRGVYRSMRWPHSRYGRRCSTSLPYRNDAAMVISPADSFASRPARRRSRCRHLRQGPPRDDDGPRRRARSADVSSPEA